MSKNQYNINDTIYHKCGESKKGIILNCRYLMLENKWEYFVVFDYGVESLWYYEHELTKNIMYE